MAETSESRPLAGQVSRARSAHRRNGLARPQEVFDTLVIGAGFGGLGTALALAERGRSVALCEALSYPGGCASTFRRDGYRFESGATLFSGFDPDQLFGRWIREHGLDVTIDRLDPVVELRTPRLRLPIHRERGELERRLSALPDAPVGNLRRFFSFQRKVADTLWGILDRPALLPPLGLRSLLEHSARSPRYLALTGLVGRPLSHVLERFGLASFEPLRVLLDTSCQITVQCSAAEAEAPFALACMDYFHRGTGHVRGGIGRLATELARAIEALGSEVRYTTRVRRLRENGGLWQVETTRGLLEARSVVANLLPQDLARLLGRSPRALDAPRRRVEEGWGACMLYRVVRSPGTDGSPRHLELVQDEARAMIEGNHLFVSISGDKDEGRAPTGRRTMSVSTHVRIGELERLSDSDRAARVGEIQERMRAGLERLAPEWSDVVHELTASPRTFERFTGRHLGYVGGVPRRAGLSHYKQLGPLSIERGLWLAGDTAFPGQSTLATATGGVRVAAAVDGWLG